jgi:two-component system C4-dicarboxylate transport sensor histidine kinase DctB
VEFHNRRMRAGMVNSPAATARHMQTTHFRTLALAAVAGIAFVAAAAWLAHAQAQRQGLAAARASAERRLDEVATGLEAEFRRFEYLPSLLEMNGDVHRLLRGGGGPELQAEVDRYLVQANAAAGAARLYVLDRAGRCIAASDAGEPGSPLGAGLSFRPYVKAALAGGRGRFYGVGVTSGTAGYFMSYALGGGAGVAVVKVSLEGLVHGWSQQPGSVWAADDKGVLVLSSRREWRYRPLSALSPQARAEIAEARPYGAATLVPLRWSRLRPLDGDASLVDFEGERYLMAGRELAPAQWKLAAMEALAPVELAAAKAAVTAGLAAAVVVLLAALLWHRLANQAALKAANDALEAKVLQRTEALRRTQGELVHAGRMALLGQMSAGLVHEINQPLAAMRTLSDNAGQYVERGRLDEARGNLRRIALLVDRLGKMTAQLKAFAHKSDQPPVAVDLRQVLANAQVLLSHRLQAQGVALRLDLGDGEAWVLGDEARLEQVLLNLLGNAIDAMAASPQRVVTVTARREAGRCVVAVQDTGPGLPPAVLARLFEPFVTTKPAGSGLGLGLMISSHIVGGLGGRLTAANGPEGGACFRIELPCAEIAFTETF